MWLSNAFNSKTKQTETLDAGPVSIDGTSPAVCTDGEQRDAEILRPANILRLPRLDEQQLVLNLPDGKSVVIGVLDSEVPDGMEAGEVYITTDNATVWVKNSGIELVGNVSVSGTLKVNGRNVSGT